MPSPFSYKNDSDEDNRVSPLETAKNLHNQEQQGSFNKDFNDLTNPDHLEKDGVSGDLGGAEEDGGWRNSVGSGGGSSRKTVTPANFRAILKRRGPVAAILSLVLGGGVGVGIFLSPGLLLVHVQEAFVEKFDSQNTSLTVRSNKILANKLTADSTSGSCNTVKIACRFSRPSNRLLGNLEKNGVIALDSRGDPINKGDSLFQTRRPATYVFEGKEIAAKDFSKTLRTNNALRAAFHRAYNPRFVGFTDAVFKTVQTRFGFDKRNLLAEAKDSAAVNEKINTASQGSDVGAKAASEGAEEAAEEVLEGLIKSRSTKALDTLSKSGKGGAVSLAAGAVCLATDIPGSVIAVSRAYQLAQLVKYSAGMLGVMSAIKASSSDVTPETVSIIGTMLTATVGGLSAMDSFGMKYALFGDTKTTDKTYKSFSPGSAAVAALGGVASITSSDITKSACDSALNPVTGAALNAALVAAGGATFGTTAAAAGINLAVGFALGEIITLVAPPLIEAALPLMQPVMGSILQTLLGDLTANLSGPAVGNALSSGAGHLMGQTANAGGNVPLTVDQAVANVSTTKEVQLAYAEEDRATLSPLDASNKNTFVGSMVHNLLPYYSQLSTLSGVLKTIGNIPLMSLNTVLKSSTASAADVSSQFSLCDDPAIKDKGVAAGPFCNIEYGIPSEYINMDPQQVVDELVNTGDIDGDTGEPLEKSDGGGLKAWLDLCTDGSTDNVASCKIDASNDPEGAKLVSMYAIYTIDYRIQQSMDGDAPETEELGLAEQEALFISSVPQETYDSDNDSTTLVSTVYGFFQNLALSINRDIACVNTSITAPNNTPNTRQLFGYGVA